MTRNSAQDGGFTWITRIDQFQAEKATAAFRRGIETFQLLRVGGTRVAEAAFAMKAIEGSNQGVGRDHDLAGGRDEAFQLDVDLFHGIDALSQHRRKGSDIEPKLTGLSEQIAVEPVGESRLKLGLVAIGAAESFGSGVLRHSVAPLGPKW